VRSEGRDAAGWVFSINRRNIERNVKNQPPARNASLQHGGDGVPGRSGLSFGWADAVNAVAPLDEMLLPASVLAKDIIQRGAASAKRKNQGKSPNDPQEGANITVPV
jgi:hypothetical protein